MAEIVIQQLLVEAGANSFDPALADVVPRASRSPPTRTLRSPETYLGARQTTGFASPDTLGRHGPRLPRAPRPRLNEWAPTGDWTLAGARRRLRGPARRSRSASRPAT